MCEGGGRVSKPKTQEYEGSYEGYSSVTILLICRAPGVRTTDFPRKKSATPGKNILQF